jgi:hypothetical protein
MKILTLALIKTKKIKVMHKKITKLSVLILMRIGSKMTNCEELGDGSLIKSLIII